MYIPRQKITDWYGASPISAPYIIERLNPWTGIYCDDAIDRRLISENEFKKIVHSILDRKKKSKETAPMVA